MCSLCRVYDLFKVTEHRAITLVNVCKSKRFMVVRGLTHTYHHVHVYQVQGPHSPLNLSLTLPLKPMLKDGESVSLRLRLKRRIWVQIWSLVRATYWGYLIRTKPGAFQLSNIKAGRCSNSLFLLQKQKKIQLTFYLYHFVK